MFANLEKLEEIVLPSNITRIEVRAFLNCKSLTSIDISKDIVMIGTEDYPSNPFYGCESLKNIRVSPDNKKYSDLDGILTNKDHTELILYPEGKMVGEAVVPEGIKRIRTFAFRYNENLISIALPNSVTTIEELAFSNCTSLTSITLPESLKEIEEGLFYRCFSLSSIEIPSSVTSIGDEVFKYCESLSSVTIGSGIKSIGSDLFYGCDKLENLYMKSSIPPSIYSWDIDRGQISLQIPKDSKEAYQTHKDWQGFKEYLEL